LEIRGVAFPNPFPRMSYFDAMKYYGIDKPDIRFGMKFVEITTLAKGKGFALFDNAEIVVGICATGLGNASKNDISKYTELAKNPDVGGSGLIWVKLTEKISSSVSKFYSNDDFRAWGTEFGAEKDDLLLIFCGPAESTRVALGRFRLAMGSLLKLRNPDVFAPLWVTDFPLLEWNEEEQRFNAMHHPFTSPLAEDLPLLDTNPKMVRAIAYDIVMNGWEIGGGSIRIHERDLQLLMFKHLGFTPETATEQFGFLLQAFQYGAPPHGGIAFGLDRLCALLGGQDSIREFIAFPKNNQGRDTMIGAPSEVDQKQLTELYIATVAKKTEK